MKIFLKKYTNKNGFTLIEVLIAVVLIGVGLLAFGVFTGNMVVQNTKGERNTQASTYAQEKLEDLRNQALNSALATGTGTDTLDGIYTRTWTITGSGGNPTSIRVTVSYANNTAAGNLSVSYKTIISQ
ncbi:MAG: type IV pilus modification PilV family protein [Nitrospinales bacterium]